MIGLSLGLSAESDFGLYSETLDRTFDGGGLGDGNTADHRRDGSGHGERLSRLIGIKGFGYFGTTD